MRKLTQKEIDDAPSWAVSYLVAEESIGGFVSYHERHYGFTRPLPNATPQRKEFDISAYEFSDLEIERAIQHDSDEVQLDMMDGSRPALINKRDAIALAKHFKLTAEDLL